MHKKIFVVFKLIPFQESSYFLDSAFLSEKPFFTQFCFQPGFAKNTQVLAKASAFISNTDYAFV